MLEEFAGKRGKRWTGRKKERRKKVVKFEGVLVVGEGF